ncbi:hypothetical protein Cni_G04349 [Canna indica]|uniref:Uncharacterized protein n=1 Tax=Canna indica TaxID=4628 RepID=A0AAQ3JV90_9LILI|nr:hypothetical protein Cni_G04349 [Canna indica]
MVADSGGNSTCLNNPINQKWESDQDNLSILYHAYISEGKGSYGSVRALIILEIVDGSWCLVGYITDMGKIVLLHASRYKKNEKESREKETNSYRNTKFYEIW